MAAGYMASSTSQRQQRQCTKCQEASRARSSQPRKEQEDGTRNRGTSASRTQGVPAASLVDPDQSPNDGAGKSDGGEFNSPR